MLKGLYSHVGAQTQVGTHILIVLGFNAHQPLCIILCRLPQKGRKEMVEEMKERDREERGK